jgi:hypothetical protein
LQQRATLNGTGLVLESVTGVQVPLLGLDVGDVEISQAVIKKFGVVEDVTGQIIGLEVKGVLELTGGVLGTDVVRENFTTTVGLTSMGNQCELVALDLGPIDVNLRPLGLGVASVDIPAATVSGQGSGAVGNLLCGLLSGLLGGVTNVVEEIVKQINRII